MNRVITLSALVLILLIGITFFFKQPQDSELTAEAPVENSSSNSPTQPSISNAVAIPETVQEVEKPDPNDPRLNRLPDGRVEFLQSVTSARQITHETKTGDRISIIKSLIADYRYAYKENPVGTENIEITKQLLGDNPMRIVFLNLDSPALVDNVLLDEWGEPLFFHALSGTQMEIRSAGIDKEMWTDDDLTSE